MQALLGLLIFFTTFLALLLAAIRIIRQRELQEQLAQAQWEAQYHRQESEIALSVSQSISTTIAARLAAVYGQDYQDYLIARQMNLTAQAQPERPRLEIIRPTGHGYNITGDSAAEWQQHRDRMNAYEQHQQPACWRKKPAYAPQSHTPPQQWQARPQIPPPAFRQPADDWNDADDWEDDDVLDVAALPVYPPALLQAPPPRGGRPRKYASNAERQRAYRERKKQNRR